MNRKYESVTDYIAASLAREPNDDRITDAALRYAARLDAHEAHAFLWSAVAHEVAKLRRAGTLAVEDDVFGEVTAEDLGDRIAPLRARTRVEKLNGEFAWVPGVGRVPWLDMTAEQHLERAAYLRTKAQGLAKTAERHEWAAKEIANAGAVCLRDIAKVVA